MSNENLRYFPRSFQLPSVSRRSDAGEKRTGHLWVHAIEQYQMEQHLPTGKGRRVVKILRPFFLTSTAFVGTKAYSEMFCFRTT